MDRQIFKVPRGLATAGVVGALAAGLLFPVAALFGQRPVGLLFTLLMPAVMLPLAAYTLWFGVLFPVRVELDRDGLAVWRRGSRFSLPWKQVHSVGALHQGQRGAPIDQLVAWPNTAPPAAALDATHAPASFDRKLGAYVLLSPLRIGASEAELAAAVERFAPGRWGVPPG